MKTTYLQSAIECATAAQTDRDSQLLRIIETMADRITLLEARLDRLSDLTVGDGETRFEDRVIEVLEVRSGSIRELLSLPDNGDRHESDFEDQVLEALERRSMSACEILGVLDDSDLERRILSTIEDNSYTVYTHIEAELEEKLDTLTQSYQFAEAVKEAVEGSIAQTVEELIEDRISLDFIGTDAEDVVRKGLRSIL